MTDDLPPIGDLREQLRALATREIANEERRHRRRRSRLKRLAVLLGLGAGLGGVAVAADLVSVGAPEGDVAPRTERYRPQGLGALSATAPDRPLPFGVKVYRNAAGESCAIAGQLRGGSVGVLRDGTFRPFAPTAAGVCGDPRKFAYFVDRRLLAGRTLIYGRARDQVKTIRVTQPNQPDSVARVTPEGAFLLVFDGELQAGAYAVAGLDADGREVR